jgi:hypothetical protein
MTNKTVKQKAFPWKKIWEEFEAWCESQKDYPYEWFEQEPTLQRLIKKYRPVQYVRTDWKKVWNAFADAYNVKQWREWDPQKKCIQKCVLKYSTKR